MFMKYECGCVGLRVGNRIIKMRDCRDLSDAMFHYDEFLHEKSAVMLSEIEEGALVDEIRTLMADGYRFREVQTALGIFKKVSRYADND